MKILNKRIELSSFFEKVAEGAVLIADYDGTLAPFSEDRMQVQLYPGVKERLMALISDGKTRLVLMSGRSLDALEKLLPEFAEVEFWGSHGIERRKEGKKIEYLDPAILQSALQEAKRRCLQSVDSKFFEEKPFSVAFHFRGMEEDEREAALSAIEQSLRPLESDILELHAFSCGLEIRPRKWNKGSAVQALLDEVPEKTAIAYLGDDATDEEAFAILGERALKVLVRAEDTSDTHADLHIVPPQELLAFLDRWIAYAR
jgi:trehalose-phosphatase